MKKYKYFALYVAPYGITVEYIGEYETIDEAKKECNCSVYLHILNEFELRAFKGSIDNVLKTRCGG